MATVTLHKKRKNIDLPAEALRKLSIMAASKGESLKAYIEGILVEKANSVSIEVSDNPSPSGDPYFDDPQNIASIKQGIKEVKQGKVKEYSIEEIRKALGA